MRESRFECADGFAYQSAAVVERDDGHFRYRPVRQRLLRETGGGFGNLVLHIVYHLHRIGAVAGNDHTADSLHALLVQAAATRCRAQRNKGDILNPDGNAVPDRYDRFFQVGHVLYIPQTANEIFRHVHLHRFRTNVEVALLYGIHHIHDGHGKRPHRIGVYLHLILLDKAADRGNIGNAVCRREGILDVEILQRPQFVRIPAAGRFARLRVPPFERVPEHLSECRSVRPQSRLNALRQSPRRQRVQFLQHARAAPIELYPVVENNIDERHAEHGRAAYRLHTRNAEQGSGQRIRHLLLNVFGRATHPFRGNNLLIFADIRNGIYGDRVARQYPALPLKRRHRHAPHNNNNKQ
ncbi:hypothetical protein Barb4_00603 [Bacteroidales bacterium Barb4]|nr:hypothetical protein Barb4_00603 [Bacteroidales bacterium Barb4]